MKLSMLSRISVITTGVIVMAVCSSCSSKEERVYRLEKDETVSTELHTIQLARAFPELSFENPLDIQVPADGTDRMFVVEQRGRILVFPKKSDAKEAKVFLDIRSRVDFDHNEQGLLGLAFDPDFKNNGHFYVNYVAAKPLRTVIARYTVSSQTPDQADVASELIILEIAQPYSNHNGGQVAFGPDGYLYIGMGDGGAAGDPEGRAQNRSELLGKILRLDVRTASETKKYTIPSDNPYVGDQQGWREEIYAYGLRNPWRFSWDGAGRLWVADVGQDKYEEVDIVEKGKNYGWNVMEGDHCFKPSEGCDMAGLERPVAEYGHDEGRSVTGGFVYEGSAIPAIKDKYVFADFVTGKIWVLVSDAEKGGYTRRQVAQAEAPISTFGRDQEGELYIACFDGHIYKLSDNL